MVGWSVSGRPLYRLVGGSVHQQLLVDITASLEKEAKSSFIVAYVDGY